MLRCSGIKIWLFTGDKQETASLINSLQTLLYDQNSRNKVSYTESDVFFKLFMINYFQFLFLLIRDSWYTIEYQDELQVMRSVQFQQHFHDT